MEYTVLSRVKERREEKIISLHFVKRKGGEREGERPVRSRIK